MTKHAEDLAKLGWQCFECPACGSDGARAFPKPEQEPVAWMRQDGQRVTTASDRHNYPDYKTRYSIPLYTSPPQLEYRAVKTYHEGQPVYVAQQEFVGRFAKFTDGIWREVTDGSAGVPLYTTPPQPEQNLNCKSVQARLATAWGYTKVQPQQEPLAWRTFDGEGGYEYRSYDMNEQYKQEWEQRNPNHKGWVEPLYISPPQRQWVGLTDEEVAYFSYVLDHWTITHIRGIEAKLKEKNAN